MQYLRLPIDKLKPTAGYKNSAYKISFKYNHYGLDCISSTKETKLYGLGNGTVVAAGLDGINGKTVGVGSACGYVLIIVYEDVYNHVTKKPCNVTCTYMHMREQPLVKIGQQVTTKTLLGNYGATGYLVTGAHLHIQIDTDIKYPKYCMGMSKNGHSILKRGTVDSTINPTDVLNLDKNQQISIENSKWYNFTDFSQIPKKPTTKNKQWVQGGASEIR